MKHRKHCKAAKLAAERQFSLFFLLLFEFFDCSSVLRIFHYHTVTVYCTRFWTSLLLCVSISITSWVYRRVKSVVHLP